MDAKTGTRLTNTPARPYPISDTPRINYLWAIVASQTFHHFDRLALTSSRCNVYKPAAAIMHIPIVLCRSGSSDHNK